MARPRVVLFGMLIAGTCLACDDRRLSPLFTGEDGGAGGDDGEDAGSGGESGSAGSASGGDAGAGGSNAADCGNRVIEGAEGCDDGNQRSGDGCGESCTVEAGWSCAGAPSLCTRSCSGAEGDECQGESCCIAPAAPAGSFLRGRGSEACSDCSAGCPAAEEGAGTCLVTETPEHTATLTAFYLDKYEVTVGRFRRYVNEYQLPAEGTGAHPRISNSGWQSAWSSAMPESSAALETELSGCTESTWTSAAADNETLPINCVTWFEAFAFCAWDGGRLPTEAEWEYASAGGNQNRLYPWGAEAPDETRAVWNCTAYGDASCEFLDILAVGSRPAGAGLFDHEDLAGSVWEWTIDWFAPYAESCDDCANLEAGTTRVFRGDGWDFSADSLRSAYRSSGDPMLRHISLGVRCARSGPVQ